MKRKASILLVIVTFSMLISIIPVTAAAANSAKLTYNVGDVKAELAEDVCMGNVLTPPSPLPGYSIPFWVDMVDAEYFPNGGEGVYIAVLDTGLLSNWPFFFPDANIKTEWGIGFTHDIYWDSNLNDIVIGPLRNDRGFITDSFKGSGHGTHVTSTIVGYRYRTATADMMIQGVAPKATIIPVLVLDAWEVSTPDGTVRLTGGTDEMVCAGIRYVGDLAATYRVKIVISMSLGSSEPSDMEEAAINYAICRGCVVVAAAGNAGMEGMDWPGAYPQVISAAAGGWTEQWVTKPPQTRWWLNDVPEKLNTEDVWGNHRQMYLEEFSSRPNKSLGQMWWDLDVCAPGASVVGPFKNYFSSSMGYYYVWGTSMATPHVSGIASILLQALPLKGWWTQFMVHSILSLAALRLPMPPCGAWVYDPFVGDLYHFQWGSHDYGRGWLTALNAMFFAHCWR